MFTINLFKNESDNATVDKVLTPVLIGESADISADLRYPTSMLDPVITLDIPSQETLPNFNYVYIGYFGRYYFVKNIKPISDELFEITLHGDVLSTQKAKVKNLECTVVRQEKSFNLYLKDEKLKVTSNTTTDYVKFPNGLTRSDVIITTM